MSGISFVFLADERQHVRIGGEGLVHPDGPGLGVSFRVIDRDFDFQLSETRPAEVLAQSPRIILRRGNPGCLRLVVPPCHFDSF